jgi:hypothetical protein
VDKVQFGGAEEVTGSPHKMDMVNNLMQEHEMLEQRSFLEERMIEAGVDETFVVSVKTDSGKTFTVPAQLLGGVPIKIAVEQLSRAYRNHVKGGNNVDVGDFVEGYTNRKFATMVDIFGYGFKTGTIVFEKSDDNESDKSKGKQPPSDGVVGTLFVKASERFDPSGEYTREREDAKEGFHSGAFGDVKNFEFLPYEALADVHGENKRVINPEIDPRAERYERVLLYKESLNFIG